MSRTWNILLESQWFKVLSFWKVSLSGLDALSCTTGLACTSRQALYSYVKYCCPSKLFGRFIWVVISRNCITFYCVNLHFLFCDDCFLMIFYSCNHCSSIFKCFRNVYCCMLYLFYVYQIYIPIVFKYKLVCPVTFEFNNKKIHQKTIVTLETIYTLETVVTV